MDILSRTKQKFGLLQLLWRSLPEIRALLPDLLVSTKDQNIKAYQLKRLLDSRHSSMQVTPILSYIDWAERNLTTGLFDTYPTSPEYSWVHTYPSKVDRMYIVASFLRTTREVPGDIAEFGVFKGHTAILLNKIRRDWNIGKNLYLFDSFEGLPDTIGADDGFTAGQFSDTSVELVRQVVGGGDSSVKIIKGFFSDTFPTVPELKYSFCHIDCDLEVAAMECLEYVVPRLSPGGIIVFDDYGFRGCLGLRKAVDRFFSHRGEAVISLPTSQAVYIKSL